MRDHISNDDTIISIGQMAEMFGISKRMLRLYHEMELLVPQYVDDSNGYRYYTTSQFPKLEMIIQMKSLGLSLKRIKIMLNTRDLSMLEALINEQIDDLEQKIMEYTLSRDSLTKHLKSYKHLRNPPELDSIFIEFIPKRSALLFNIEEYDFLTAYPDDSPWEKALQQIKSILMESSISLAYFQQVHCMISQESLLQGKYLCDGACILTDEIKHNLPQDTVQAGTYVCMYRRYIAKDNRSESEALGKLLQYIHDNSYQIVGPYIGEIVAQMSAFDYDDHNILVKLQIPVKIIDK